MQDTIVAISTPPGRGGIGIIRISGKSVTTIAPKLLGHTPAPRKAQYSPFLSENGSILEKVIALFFPKPNSFTGEDILEIHGHGGEIILDLLLEQILKISSTIRLARPGEFTERAFLNGKIDLIQAESVADIINASSYRAAKSASNSLQGIFSNQIHMITKRIIKLRMNIELSFDFSEENISSISYNEIKNCLKNIINDTKKIYQSTQNGVLLREGLNIVIAGKPNAGKSSLFNKLINIDRAIVSAISGTTRDVLHESIQLNGINLHIADTAGIKKNSNNEIEKLSIQRTWNALNHADHILWVVDSNDHINKNYDSILNSIQKNIHLKNNTNIPITIIRNKSDLSLEKNGIKKIQQHICITLSTLKNDGIDLLKQYLLRDTVLSSITIKDSNNTSNYNYIIENQGNFIARRRHLDLLEKSSQYLLSAQKQLLFNTTINDLFAEDLKLAQCELEKIIGDPTSMSKNLLDDIFSKFCIGK